MPKLTPHFYALYNSPEEIKAKIRAAYAAGGTMEEAARKLQMSTSHLRVYCRKLRFDPVAERRGAKNTKARASSPT